MGIASFTLLTLSKGRRKLQQLFAHQAKEDHFPDPASEGRAADLGQYPKIAASSADVTAVLATSLISHNTSTSCIQGSVQTLSQQPPHEKWSFTLPATQLLPGYCVAPMAIFPDAIRLGLSSQKPAGLRAMQVVVKPSEKKSLKSVRRLSGSGNGRFVIAGRMADVCAELDRLVACEALGYAA